MNAQRRPSLGFFDIDSVARKNAGLEPIELVFLRYPLAYRTCEKHDLRYARTKVRMWPVVELYEIKYSLS